MLTLRSGPVHVRSFGVGQPVLCLHATGHDGSDFAPLAARIGDRYGLHALDFPGQGQSPASGVPPRASAYADIALEACAALGLEHPIVIGNSIGGAAAILAAHRAPRSIRAVVLCNPGGLAPIDATARVAIGFMVAFFAAGARGAPWFETAFAAYYSALVLPRAPQRRRAIITQSRALAPLLAEAWRGFAQPDADLRAIASALPVPVWCAWARDDRLVSWARAKAAVRRIPSGRATLFRGGHAAFLEDSDQFAAAFDSFVRDLQ